MSPKTRRPHSSVATVAAKFLSGLVLMFIGGFMIAYFVGGEESSNPESATAADLLGLAALIASLVGLALAWKWPRLGSSVTLVAVIVGTVINWRVLMFPLCLIPIAAILFLAATRLKARDLTIRQNAET